MKQDVPEPRARRQRKQTRFTFRGMRCVQHRTRRFIELYRQLGTPTETPGVTHSRSDDDTVPDLMLEVPQHNG